MEEAKLAILTDAKNEYSHQLVNVLKTYYHILIILFLQNIKLNLILFKIIITKNK